LVLHHCALQADSQIKQNKNPIVLARKSTDMSAKFVESKSVEHQALYLFICFIIITCCYCYYSSSSSAKKRADSQRGRQLAWGRGRGHGYRGEV